MLDQRVGLPPALAVAGLEIASSMAQQQTAVDALQYFKDDLMCSANIPLLSKELTAFSCHGDALKRWTPSKSGRCASLVELIFSLRHFSPDVKCARSHN
jgi:hypothetical protein